MPILDPADTAQLETAAQCDSLQQSAALGSPLDVTTEEPQQSMLQHSQLVSAQPDKHDAEDYSSFQFQDTAPGRPLPSTSAVNQPGSDVLQAASHLPAPVLDSSSQSPPQHLHQQRQLQHQLGQHRPAGPLCISFAELNSAALNSLGQEAGVMQPLDRLQQLPVLSGAAPSSSAASVKDVIRMQPDQLGSAKHANQGIGRFMGRQQPLPSSADSTSASQAQNVFSSLAADIPTDALLQQGEDSQMHQQHQEALLPPNMLGGSKGAQAAQGLRRRFSFAKGTKGEDPQGLQSQGMQSLNRLVSEGSTALYDGKDDSIMCSGSSLVSRALSISKHHSGRVVPADSSSLLTRGMSVSKHSFKRVVPESAAVVGLLDENWGPLDSTSDALRQASESQNAGLPMPDDNWSSKHAVTRQAQKVKKSDRLITSKALHQSIAQVKACTLQLQQQQREQQSMRPVLQAMNSRIAKILDNQVFSVQSSAI